METKFPCETWTYYWIKFHNWDVTFLCRTENNVNNKKVISATPQTAPQTQVCFLYFQQLYFSLFPQFNATSRMRFINKVLFVAHTDTDWWSVSFTDQQTDTWVHSYLYSCKKQFQWHSVDQQRTIRMTCSYSSGVSVLESGFFSKQKAMNFLYTLTSFIMLHKMASLQLTYPVTLQLLKHFSFNLLFMLLGGCYILVMGLSHWNGKQMLVISCQQALIIFYILPYKIFYDIITLWAAAQVMVSSFITGKWICLASSRAKTEVWEEKTVDGQEPAMKRCMW
jgi:hypothetical protein